MPSPKAHYTSHLSTLLSISLFSGLFSFLALLFLSTTCTSPALLPLLTLTTTIFLTNILTHLLLSILLYPLHESTLVLGTRRRLLRLGLAVIYLFLSTGFILLALCIHTTYAGNSDTSGKGLGWLGVSLFTVVLVGIVGVGYSTKGPDGDAVEADTPVYLPNSSARQIPKVGKPKTIIVLIVFILEVLSLIALLGMGGNAAMQSTPRSTICSGNSVNGIWTKQNPLPVEVLGTERVDVVVSVTVTEKGECGNVCVGTGTGTDVGTGLSGGKGGGATVVVWTSTTTTILVGASTATGK